MTDIIINSKILTEILKIRKNRYKNLNFWIWKKKLLTEVKIQTFNGKIEKSNF